MPTYRFHLYITGMTPRSLRASANLRRICEQCLGAEGIDYELCLIDILEQPDLAEQAHIFATPTTVRTDPPPIFRIIGDLSDAGKVLAALGITPCAPASLRTGKESLP